VTTDFGYNRIHVSTKMIMYEAEGEETHPSLILLGQLLDVTNLQRCIFKECVHEPEEQKTCLLSKKQRFQKSCGLQNIIIMTWEVCLTNKCGLH
jgi:hypothetical protein